MENVLEIVYYFQLDFSSANVEIKIQNRTQELIIHSLIARYDYTFIIKRLMTLVKISS